MSTTPEAAKEAITPKLVIRTAQFSDVTAITALSERVYGPEEAYLTSQIRGHISAFPEGQFVADFEGAIVGYCATFIVSEELAIAPHSWVEITGGGFASRHNPDGDVLYGLEVLVDPSFRRLRIGQRFYQTRQDLCEYLELKGIIFGGRMPGYAEHAKDYPEPLAYLSAVQNQTLQDPVVNFQLKQGFEPLGVLRNYMPSDKASGGAAAHMSWRNPLAPEAREAVKSSRPDSRLPQSVRVATVQFQMRKLTSIKEFEDQVEYFVDVASDYKCDFVMFPELFTLQLLSLEEHPPAPAESIIKVSAYADRFRAFMEKLAVSYNINIIGGSHPTQYGESDVRNTAYVFLRDGAVHTQDKLHPTPAEREWWNIKGGDTVSVIPTDCGPVGVMVCYDAEFPEVARHLADQGAVILFVPFCTDERRGYMRVRYCCHARAVENQCYVAMAGVVGNLPNVESMDIHYAESCILTPSDFPFARDGVAADTAPNTETIAIADLSLPDLIVNRQSGTVRNFKDRRFDLYRVSWRKR